MGSHYLVYAGEVAARSAMTHANLLCNNALIVITMTAAAQTGFDAAYTEAQQRAYCARIAHDGQTQTYRTTCYCSRLNEAAADFCARYVQ